jgi:thiol-disulfide isomerase/thioredoxin
MFYIQYLLTKLIEIRILHKTPDIKKQNTQTLFIIKMKLLQIKLVLLFLLSGPLSAQIKKHAGASFTLKPETSDDVPDSIVATIFTGVINGEGSRIRITAKKNMDGTFGFSLPEGKPITVFRIDFYYPDQPKMINPYYAEPFDKIKVTFRRGSKTDKNDNYMSSLAFTGIGVEKYKITDLLREIKKDLYISESNRIKDEFGFEDAPKGIIEDVGFYKKKEFKNYLSSLSVNVRANIKRQQDTLKKYRTGLGKGITAFFGYELSSYDYLNFFCSQLYRRSTTEANKQVIARFYLSELESIRPILPVDTLFKYGIEYKFAKSTDIMQEIYYKSNGAEIPFEFQYNKIKAIKNHELRDILITQFLTIPNFQLHISDFNKKDSCLSDALKFIKSPELVLAIKDQNKFSKGSIVYNFSFLDTTGKTVSLKDLEGNVFLIDFYGSGCGPCSGFAKNFERNVYPEFANESTFKVISVSVDKKRESWIKGMNSGLYTQKESINLNTGVGFNHPIMKYYKVYTIPFVLLIDKNGKLIARLEAQSNSEIKKMIREALDKNQDVKSTK